jgi:hypothetical protein
MTAMTDIRAALEQQLVTVTGIPSSSNRAWENVRFEPTPGIDVGPDADHPGCDAPVRQRTVATVAL